MSVFFYIIYLAVLCKEFFPLLFFWVSLWTQSFLFKSKVVYSIAIIFLVLKDQIVPNLDDESSSRLAPLFSQVLDYFLPPWHMLLQAHLVPFLTSSGLSAKRNGGCYLEPEMGVLEEAPCKCL